MSNTNVGTQKAFILWLNGALWADVRELPEAGQLIEHGLVMTVEPSPITGPKNQHYQVLSGRSPASFGLFDTLVPRGYTVVEETTGRGTPPKLLPDLLRTVGWSVKYEETDTAELVASVERLIQSSTDSPTCSIIKCAVRYPVDGVETGSIAHALRLVRDWAGESGLVAVLSDMYPAAIERFVNVNNFLADMGVIERDEQSGRVQWQNSLAYFVGHGQLWVNLLGRDSQGAVHPQDEYEEVREALIKALPAKLRDPETGVPVIERVYRKEELYSREYLFCAPDLVVVFKPGYAPSPASSQLGFDSTTFTTSAGATATAGIHPSTLRGLLLTSAPALASGRVVTAPVPLTAIVPTVLHALGVENMPTEVAAVEEAFSSSYLETHPIRASIQDLELSEEEEELVIGRLRDLGYV